MPWALKFTMRHKLIQQTFLLLALNFSALLLTVNKGKVLQVKIFDMFRATLVDTYSFIHEMKD
jgi:hypothetical protein